MFGISKHKAVLLLAPVLAVAIAQPTPAWAANGVWFYFDSDHTFTVNLINLTDLPLTAKVNNVSTDGNGCYCYPFQYFGINVLPNNTSVWRSYPGSLDPNFPHGPWSQDYSGKITLLPQGMDKWSFDLNFYPQKPHSGLGKGTWVYLTPTNMTPDYSLRGWVPSWDPNFPDLYPYYNGYATRLNDGKMHNLMSLQGFEFAVSVFSPDNVNLVVVVQSTHGIVGTDQYPDFYQAWMLDWVDNNSDTVP